MRSFEALSRSPHPPVGPPTARRLPVRTRAGFSLVEIMVVVMIISVLAMCAVPVIQRAQRRTKSTAIGNDFRVFAGAFEAYAQENGSWPPDSKQGVFPPAMAGRISPAAWLRKSPMGGQYNWENGKKHAGTTYTAAITVKATKSAPLVLDVAQLEDLDDTIDDGNLKTGVFRTGAGNVPLFIIQK